MQHSQALARLPVYMLFYREVPWSYLGRPLGRFYASAAHRLLAALLLGVALSAAGFLGAAVHEGPWFALERFDLVSGCALRLALLFSTVHILVDAAAHRSGQKTLAYEERTVGRQWLLAGLGFMLAFLAHGLLTTDQVGSLAPWLADRLAQGIGPRPAGVVLLMYLLPLWCLAMGAVILAAQAFQPSGAETGVAKPEPDPSPRPLTGVLTLESDGRRLAIAHDRLVQVTVEDHYCRILYLESGRLKCAFLRVTLSRLAGLLPATGFARIHRSHLVNLAQVQALEASNGAHVLVMKGSGSRLPVSRRRLPQVRKLLGRLPASG